MKRFKLLFALLAVVAVSGATLAFKSAKKFTAVTYYYTGADKRIGAGANELVEAQVKNTNNFTTVNPGYTLTTGTFLAAIVIDEPTLDITDAVDELWSEYAPNKVLPLDNQSFAVGTSNITIRRKTSN